MEIQELAKPLKELEDYETKANNEEIVAWFRKVRVSCLDSTSAHAIFLKLQEILRKNDIDLYDEKSPYYNILLAFVHDFFGDTDSAIVDVDLTVLGFKKLGKQKDWHQAISNWFYGLLLCKQGQFERAKAKIDDAIKIISKMDKEQNHFGQYSNKYKDMIAKIKVSDENMRSEFQSRLAEKSLQINQSENPNVDKKPLFPWPRNQHKSAHRQFAPDDTPMKLPGSGKKPHDPKLPLMDESELSSKNSEPSLRHIIIPVDVRALKDLNVNSIFLESDLFEQLQSYEKIKENRQKPEKGTANPKHLVIPRFPNYGKASAGPNGIPNLSNHFAIEKANSVDETLTITFDGILHHVNLKNKDEISDRDGKTYGWLKVIGESMNNASPISINDKDYILFCFNNDMEYCTGKIVVAYLPEGEPQPSQLVVKRLMKSKEQYLLQNKHPEFVLHSESTLDEDPITGLSLKKDIKIVSDNQIVGEVIAIAKPK